MAMPKEGNVFYSYDEAKQFIYNHEVAKGVKYVSISRNKDCLLTSLLSLDGHKIRFEEKRDKDLPIHYNGCPFILLGTEQLGCHQGKSRKKKVVQDGVPDDHSYRRKKRMHVQDTKNVGCLARVKMRMLIRFPTYQIEGPSSERCRKAVSKRLREDFVNGNVEQKYEVMVTFINQHSIHAIGEDGEVGLPIDKKVTNKIKSLVVEEGITDASAVQTVLKHCRKELPASAVRPTNRRFNPSLKDIQGHISAALKSDRYSDSDMTNLKFYVNKQKDTCDDHLFLQTKSSEGDKFMFVHQTRFQKRLLLKYGLDLVLMDATYKTTRYNLPLFFLAVLTNCGYFVVATFIVENETSSQIANALQLIKDWNPDWIPKAFMCDMDTSEISAIEKCFGCNVFTCAFHQEQSWNRWLVKTKNKAANDKDEILNDLRKIANADSETELDRLISEMKRKSYYINNSLLQNWIGNYWLEHKKRWVRYYRSSVTEARVTTTNGIERIHLLLKKKYVKSSGKNLCSMIKIIVEEFIPEGEQKYRKKNFMYKDSHKVYNKNIPTFLHNRPRKFVQHCLQRIGKVDANDITYNSECFCCGNYKLNMDQPSCTCPDFVKNCWPCKHMLCIMLEFPSYGWDFLPNDYTSLPCFLLDDLSDINVNVSDRRNVKFETGKRVKVIELLKTTLNHAYECEETDIDDLYDSLKGFLSDDKCSAKIPMPDTRFAESDETDFQRPKKKRKITPFHTEVQNSCLEKDSDMDISLESGSNILLPEFIDWEYKREDEEEVDRIWLEGARNNVLGQIGKYLLYENSIEFIKSNLSDEVIDAFFHCLSATNTNVLHINCVTMTSIINGDKNLHGLLRTYKLMSYETIIGAYNAGGNHWTLLIIKPQCKEIVFFNSLGTGFKEQQTITYNWFFFLKLRYDAGLEEVSAENWTLNCPPCARQSDGSSCGIYVLKFAENWLNGKSLLFRWNQMEIFSARKSLAIYMVSTAKNTEPSNINMTTKTNDKTQEDEVFCVCKEADNGKLYWQCIWCDEWFHPSCIKRDDVESSPNPFYCDECLDINLRSWDVINYFDDEDEDSETFAINSSAALSKMKDAYKICYKITTSTASKSKMEWLQSHLRFVDGKRILCNGYGFGVFTQQALFNVKRNLMKHFFEKKSCVSVQGTVPQMANEKMIRAFQEDGYLASEYVSNVLLEEALKKIMQLVFGISYKVSHGYLKITVSNSMNRSVNKALEIREKIKARIQRNK